MAMTQITLISAGVVVFVMVIIVLLLRYRNKRKENTKREGRFQAKVNRNVNSYVKLNNKIKNLQFMIEKNASEIAKLKSLINKKNVDVIPSGNRSEILEGRVTALHGNVAAVMLPSGESGYLPAEEVSDISLSSISNISNVLQINQAIDVSVIGLDNNGELMLTAKLPGDSTNNTTQSEHPVIAGSS